MKRCFTCDPFLKSYEGLKAAFLAISTNLVQLTGNIVRAVNV